MDLTIVSPFITTQKMFLEVPFIHSIILLLILKKDLFLQFLQITERKFVLLVLEITIILVITVLAIFWRTMQLLLFYKATKKVWYCGWLL